MKPTKRKKATNVDSGQKSKKKTDTKDGPPVPNKTMSNATLLAEKICNEINHIEENYSKIDMNDWNLDDFEEESSKATSECPVELTSADDVEESDDDQFACDEIYSNGERDIKRYITAKWSRKIGNNMRLVTAIPQLSYDQLRWLIKVKILKDLKKIIDGKLSSFYHSNFTSHKTEMPAALIRKTMFSENQFRYICGSLKGLFVKKQRVFELNYALHVLLPETLIRMVMFVKKVNYKDAQKLMDTHLFAKSTPSLE